MMVRQLSAAAVTAALILSAGAVGAARQAAPAAKPQGEFVYDTGPYPQVHASTLVETTSGTLLTAWFGGTEEGHDDVSIWLARRENGRWSPGVKVADGVQRAGKRHPTWNPVLFQPRGGPLQLYYKVGPSPREWWGMVIESTDDGRTWGAPRRLPDGILGPIKNKPVVLTDGSWLSPSSDESDGWRVHFEHSRDAGKTWRKIGPVATGPKLEAIQPSVLLHKDGRLQALCRSKQGVVAQTWSKDGGRTWTPLTAAPLPNPNSGTDAVTLADGRHVIVYNHSGHRPHEAKGNRWPLDVAISDDGLDWRRVVTLETQPNKAGYAYPAVIQSSDGFVHITYTWDRTRIKHVVLDPKKL
jgi:predicted neuraminidase